MWPSSCFHFFITIFGSLGFYFKSTTNVIAARVTLFDEIMLRARPCKFDETTFRAKTFKVDETTNLKVGAFNLDKSTLKSTLIVTKQTWKDSRGTKIRGQGLRGKIGSR